MVKFAKNRNSKREVLCCKNPIKIWDVYVNNTVISKLVKTKVNSRCLIGYLDKDIWDLVLIRSKMNGYVTAFKVEYNNKNLFSYR